MPALKTPAALLEDGREYGFFQALRLLRLDFADDQAFQRGVWIRPRLGLGFPERDIDRIARDPQGRVHIEANFFGLYGVSSPLPTFYSEDLIDEQQQDGRAMRDFLDILHAALYPLLFQAWEKYRSWLVISERQDARRLQQLFALVGLADQACQQSLQAPLLLRYAGLFNQQPRSAAGLEALLRGLLDSAQVSVQPCVERWIRLEPQERAGLGVQCAQLGEDCLLGDTVLDRGSSLEIQIGALSALDFHLLLPGSRRHSRLAQAVALYLQRPLACWLRLGLRRQEQCCASLAAGWQRLGLDTWLGEQGLPGEVLLPLATGRLSTDPPPRSLP